MNVPVVAVGVGLVAWSSWMMRCDERRPCWRWRGLWLLNVGLGLLVVLLYW